MLINFSLENWRSFREQVTFSMVASEEDQYEYRIPDINMNKLRVLPIAAIYGGNASGKTNFFKAIQFAKTLVVNGTRPDNPIPIEIFRLDDKMTDQPSRFIFTILADNIIYEFMFSVTRSIVVEEKLTEITRTDEKVLYNRCDGNPNLDKSLSEQQLLEFTFKGTRDNQLFLTNSVFQNLSIFRPVYNWFRDTIELIAPDSRFAPFERFLDEGNPLYSKMNTMLSQLDTGIAHLGGEDIPFASIPFPESMKAKIQEDVKDNSTVRMVTESSGNRLNQRIAITRKDGDFIAKKLVAYHEKEDGTEVKFDLRQESDGSQRVINLLPAILELSSPETKKVYIIDEIDRSLHTLLTRSLLKNYLSNCSANTRSQLLFTTHDVLLMDQDLLRLDEMWVAERDDTGGSTLISFYEYKDAKDDKDIRKSYLRGKLGGIPNIFLGDILVNRGSIEKIEKSEEDN